MLTERAPVRFGRGPPADRTDRGATLVEILVAIVLLGMTVGGVLTTLRVSISASTLGRDHANAHAWLQTATDVLYGSERQDCGTRTTSRADQVRDAYQAIVVATENPEGWPKEQIEVLDPVLFWNGETYQGICYDDDLLNLQLITLQVRNLDGRIVESVQVVKG